MEETSHKGIKIQREHIHIFKEPRSDLVSSLKSCIDNWCNKHGIHRSNHSEWKEIVKTFWNDLGSQDIIPVHC